MATLAGSAANDAATVAVDGDHLRATGEFRLDERRVREVVAAAIESSSVEVDLDEPVVDVVTVDGQPAVRVELTGTIDYVFADAVPGAPDRAEVGAVAVAVAAAG